MLYALLLCLGFLLGLGRGASFTARREAVAPYMESEVHAELTVKEISYTNAYTAGLIVSVDALNGEPVNATALLNCSYTAPFRAGDRIAGKVCVQHLSYGSFYETQEYWYMSEGCHVMLVSEQAQDITLIKSGERGLRDYLTDLRLMLAETVSRYMSGEAGQLLKAMLLGQRDGLSDSTVRNFQRAGVSHLLALSGLHVGILAFIVDRLCLICGAKRKYRILLTVALLLAYVGMTGAALSTVRAALMILAVYLAFFLRARADTLTALFLAAAAILAVHPFAVFSASYQMTVLATFGIVAYGKLQSLFTKRQGNGSLLRSGVKWLLSSLLVTFSAGFAVLPVQWLRFGTISAITPVANLILIPLSTPFLCLGLCVLFLFPPRLFAACCNLLGNAMLDVTSFLARAEAVFSLEQDFMPFILWPCLAAAVILLLIDLKKRAWLSLLPMASFFLAFAVAMTVTVQLHKGELTVLYRSSGKNEGLLCVAEGNTMLIDLSSGSKAQLTASWQMLCDEGATELDVLMLTHYHSALQNAIPVFCQNVVVRELWMPTPQTEEEALILEALFYQAEAAGVTVTLYDFDSALTVFGRGTLRLSTPLFEKRSVEPAFSLTLTYGEDTLYYESAALSEYHRAAGLLREPISADLYILGAHGPVPHETVEISAADGATVLIPNATVLLHLDVKDGVVYLVDCKAYRALLQ
ncbi:MAG: ComEC/Rec2 family competence protein [Clostridia bacterium]|nr:ComEC/Rec2 family competence protein [Clostridia bacterium]